MWSNDGDYGFEVVYMLYGMVKSGQIDPKGGQIMFRSGLYVIWYGQGVVILAKL